MNTIIVLMGHDIILHTGPLTRLLRAPACRLLYSLLA